MMTMMTSQSYKKNSTKFPSADPEALQENTTSYITVNKSDRYSYNLNTEIDVTESQERKDYTQYTHLREGSEVVIYTSDPSR